MPLPQPTAYSWLMIGAIILSGWFPWRRKKRDRFLHEFVRGTPRVAGPFSGYHFAAAGTFLPGFRGYRRRRSAGRQPVLSDTAP